jgi:hypothetical protein
MAVIREYVENSRLYNVILEEMDHLTLEVLSPKQALLVNTFFRMLEYNSTIVHHMSHLEQNNIVF